jgi:fibronectin type 3 domain-containing protein
MDERAGLGGRTFFAILAWVMAAAAMGQAFPTPTGLAVTASSSFQVQLSWGAVSVAGGYLLYRTDLSRPLAAVTGTSFTDTTVTPGATYTYMVASADCSGDPASPLSSGVSVQTYTLPTISLSASATSTNSIGLSWTASDAGGPGLARYSVSRNNTLLTPSPITATSYNDTGLAQGRYTYTVTAYDAVGDSASASATASTYPAPTISVAATTVSASSIALSWSSADTGGPGIHNYNVYRGATLLTASPITATTYTDTGLAAGTTYSYSVTAYDSVGDPAAANASATTYPLPTVSLAAAALSSTSVSLSWTASDSGGPGLSNYSVYRNGTLLTTTTSTGYTDSGLSAGTGYSYTVTAHDTVGDSGSASATVSAYATPVVSVSATTVSSSSIALSWSASDNGGPGLRSYSVYRNGALLTSTSGTAYTDSGLVPGTSYSYTVTALDVAGDTGSGTVGKSTYTLPSVSVTANSLSPSSISIAWTASDSGGPGIANYSVYRNGGLLTTTTSTSYTDTGLAVSTSYSYTVTAVDTAGDSASGAASQATWYQITSGTGASISPLYTSKGPVPAACGQAGAGPCQYFVTQAYGSLSNVRTSTNPTTACPWSNNTLASGYSTGTGNSCLITYATPAVYGK